MTLKNKQMQHPAGKLTTCALLLIIVLFSGCSGKNPVVAFTVKADESVNDGQPVYMVVRTVNSSDFVTEDYQSVAGMVMVNPSNETVISTNLILPGEKTKIEFTKPDNRSIAVYCMFTKPEQWKLYMQKPLDKKYKFVLEENNVYLKGMSR